MNPMLTHPALAALKARFPTLKLAVKQFRDMTTVVVVRENLVEVAGFLRDDPATGFDMLFDLNGVDYLNYPQAPHRFAVNYGLSSTASGQRLWLKVFLDPTRDTSPSAPVIRDEDAMEQGDPGLKVDSVTAIWPAAEWMEREVYDLLGMLFVGHPDLRRILTWNGFGSHPLRKDYPLRGVGERENYKTIARDSA